MFVYAGFPRANVANCGAPLLNPWSKSLKMRASPKPAHQGRLPSSPNAALAEINKLSLRYRWRQPSSATAEQNRCLREEPGVVDMELETAVPNTEIKIGTDEPQVCFSSTTPPKIPVPEVTVRISPTDRHSAELVAELLAEPEASPGRTATKIAIARTPPRAERRSVRHSLKLRYSLAGLRHSMKQDAVRRTSRRSILKKKSTRAGNSMCSSNVSGE